MKTVPKFYTKNPETVEAYQPKDIEALRSVLNEASQVWRDTWREQGATDEGTCCGGKGIQIWYVGKCQRTAEKVTVVACNWVQGNISASRSVKPALEYLESQGITGAVYYDGWMD